MLNLGTGELLVIFLVALIVLGPNKLPDAARQLGKAMGELRRLSGGFQDEMRAAMRDVTPTLPPLPPPSEADAPAESKPLRRRAPLRAERAAPGDQQKTP